MNDVTQAGIKLKLAGKSNKNRRLTLVWKCLMHGTHLEDPSKGYHSLNTSQVQSADHIF